MTIPYSSKNSPKIFFPLDHPYDFDECSTDSNSQNNKNYDLSIFFDQITHSNVPFLLKFEVEKLLILNMRVKKKNMELYIML